jgi:hydrogenase-4 component B
MHLGLDPLSLFFILLLIPQLLPQIMTQARAPSLWVCILGMLIALAGQDAFALLFGLGLMSAGLFFASGLSPRQAKTTISFAMISNACLIPAVFLPAGGLAFALVSAAAAAQTLAVLYHPARLPPLAGAIANVAFYVLLRYAFIVFGAAAAPWWGLVIIAAAAPLACFAALRAVLEVGLKTCLAWSTVTTAGLGLTAAGIALYAKAINHPALATIAIDAALLTLLTHALCKPMLLLGAGVIEHATGTTSLDWLGGLMRGMPRLGMLMLLAAIAMAALPPGPGFAALWLLLHATIAAATGGVPLRIFFTALICLLGLTAALTLGAAARIIGIGFLGRPRTLRAAAAEEAPRRILITMTIFGTAMLPIALVPGLVIRALAPVASMLTAGAAPVPLAYAPLPLSVLMAIVAGAAWLLLRRFATPGTREVPAWNDGAGKPPAWLPFGDPATQPSATGLSQPIFLTFAPALQTLSALRLPARSKLLRRRLLRPRSGR